MKKWEEINLLKAMIADTERELRGERKDRIHLEGELKMLMQELRMLLYPSKSILHLNANSHGKR